MKRLLEALTVLVVLAVLTVPLDILGLPTRNVKAVIFEKTLRVQPMTFGGKASWVQEQPFVRVSLEGETRLIGVTPQLFYSLKPGDEVQVRYQITRLWRNLQIESVERAGR